jgi:hypothetical protein
MLWFHTSKIFKILRILCMTYVANKRRWAGNKNEGLKSTLQKRANLAEKQGRKVTDLMLVNNDGWTTCNQ